jgi:nucleoside 2-deoxyribosyltransferase
MKLGGFLKMNKKCFIITPIGEDDSDIRRSAEGVIDAVIMPILYQEGYEVIVAHRISNSDSINKQVITHVIEDDLVVANLTGLNPNVMYELAIRHASRKPVIQICEKGTRLPFDIVDERTIFYMNDMLGVIELREKFLKTLKETGNESEPDNPIYRVMKSNKLLHDVNVTDRDKYFLDRLDGIEKSLSVLVNNNSNMRDSNSFEKFSLDRYILGIKLLNELENFDE